MSISPRFFSLILVLPVLLAAPSASATQTGALTVQVYSDGSSIVSQSVAAPSGATTVDVPLLTTVLSNIVATDGSGAPLSFKIVGSNITVYTLGATSVLLRYDTEDLTQKTGTVWDVKFTARYNSTVTLPAGATLMNVSGAPYSINVQNGSPVVALAPGAWELDYGVPLSTGSTQTTTQGGPPGGAGDPMVLWLAVGVVGAVAVGALLVYWRSRRGRVQASSSELRQDDILVLNFIQEKGGRVTEPEIRARFALPKTSTWRQIKRLERLGWVRVSKAGSQNQVELLKKRDDAPTQ